MVHAPRPLVCLYQRAAVDDHCLPRRLLHGEEDKMTGTLTLTGTGTLAQGDYEARAEVAPAGRHSDSRSIKRVGEINAP